MNITYRNHDGDLVEGVVWCPGPVARSVWVLPTAGAHNTECVAVKLAKRSGGQFTDEHKQVGGTPISDGRWIGQGQRLDNRFASKLAEADWRAVVGPLEQLSIEAA